jgi:hypothetical protein
MPILPTINLPPPTSWAEFESLMAELCVREWQTSLVTRNGRQGQGQDGVDIYGYPQDDRLRLNCVQCKQTTQPLAFATVVAEVKKAKAFKPQPSVFVIATTAPSDARLLEQVREAQRRWPFRVVVRAWDDLQLACTRFPDLVEQFWPSLAGAKVSVAHVRDIILNNGPESFLKAYPGGGEIRFIYRHDVQLAVVIPGELGEEFEEDWIRVFPAHKIHPIPARRTEVSVVYGAQQLATFTFIGLDGSRYLLPMPAAADDLVIDEFQAALGRIVGKGVQHEFDEGMRRTGMRIVPKHEDSLLEWLPPPPEQPTPSQSSADVEPSTKASKRAKSKTKPSKGRPKAKSKTTASKGPTKRAKGRGTTRSKRKGR